MKQTYLFCLLFVSLFSSAQIINFPDANFKAKLLAANPTNTIASDIFGNFIKIDTNDNSEIEITEAQQVKFLNVSYSNISSLVGISNFTNIQFLDCTGNQIISLDVSQNLNIINLYCEGNNMTNLNLGQNNALTLLVCSYNQITNLDVTQNTNLFTLECADNLISNINLTQNLILNELFATDNQLTTLNVTQNTALERLYIENNQVTTLDLSNNSLLNMFFCDNNLLTTLDVSQNTLLTQLGCSNNQLQSLIIKNNNSTWVSNQFFISGNPNLQYICADEGEFSFVQQKINAAGYSATCNLNSYCSFTPNGTYYTVQGQTKFDNENDGCDISDNSFSKIKFSIFDGTTTGSIISNNTGNYSIPVQAGSHTITPILENPTYFTISPTNVVVNFPTQTSPFTQDFCVVSNGNHSDVEISIIPIEVARPGFDAFYKIIYKNKGNQVENGIINLQFNDAILDLVISNPAISNQILNNLSWTYSNLLPFETREIIVVMNVNSPMETPAVNSGDILNYTVTNMISNTDEMTSDNTFNLNQTVVNSYDPNDKTCLEGNTISPDKVGDYVHYVIRFENTGTFPAENIVVKDMIDTSKFDVSSLVPLHASHNYFTRITGNNAEFIFENINLPFDDANNDGYIAFKIKTLPSLIVGNTFSNSANIYFDYNFPIVTNTATTTIAALSNPSFEFANYFSLYPNPTTNELNINLKQTIEINSIQIYNAIGQLVTVQTGNVLKVDVSNLKTGNYFIKINTNEGYSTSQFIKE